jgi:dynein intermediate chain 3, axonemal
MPADPPDGIKPLFLRGVTTEKFGMKTGEGITDLVDSMYIKTSDILDEVQTLGKMSDWEPAKKELQDYPEEEILIVVDLKQEYGEMFLLVTTLEAKEEYEKKLKDAADAIAAQKKAEEEAEAARVAAEYERLNRVYEDKPIEPRPWETDTMADTEEYVDGLKFVAYRDPIVLEITRPKKQIGQNLRFFDRNAEFSGVHEFKPQKDPNFKEVVERDIGFQAAPFLVDSPAQTSWNRLVNKSIQYEGRKSDDLIENMKDQLLGFLEKNLHAVESALQQNESVDIFNDTFDLVGMEDVQDNSSTANELKEVKNFADPTYSKFKALVAIDWLPNMPGMLAVSAVKNITFDARAAKSGMISTSHLLIWDFKQLVKPSLVLQCQHEILCFKFNKANPGLIIGGTMTGQVVMWDIADALRRSNNKNDDNDDAGKDGDDDSTPLAPILQSSIDFSHKKGVADIFWLPPDTQINFRGNLVADEHLDGQQYQFITISGDGCVFVWDIRYKDIAREELKHIGRAKSVPIEKQKNKDDEPKVLFAPIYKAALKRTEGVGEFSLNKLNAVSIVPAAVKEQSTVEGDKRAQIVVGTEEGDVLYVDLCVPAKGASHAVDDDAADEREGSAREYVRWTQIDHARPSVSVQLCPFFPDLVLTVSDWNFHVWKVSTTVCQSRHW